MEFVACQSCGLPRIAEDAAAGPCPACGWKVGEPIPPHDEQLLKPKPVAPPPPQPEPKPDRRWGAIAAVGIAVAVFVGVMFALPGDDFPAPPPEPAPVEEVASGPTPPPAPFAHVAPPPRVVDRAASVLFVPLVVPLPPLPTALRFDSPDEDLTFPRLADGSHVRLVGKVNRLYVNGVEGGSTLDASGLTAKVLIISGKIDGGSTLLAHCTGSAVTVKGMIVGRSRVVVEAPTAYVAFVDYSGKEKGPRVGEGSEVTLSARSVAVAGSVAGKGTRFDLTFTPPGTLKFTALEDGALLRYRTEHRADPAPRVTPGKITGGAVLKEEPPAKK